MKRIFAFLISISLVILMAVAWQSKEDRFSEDESIKESAAYAQEVLTTNLEIPWALDFLPDGTMIFTERDGSVFLYRNNETLQIAQIDVHQEVEAGMHGVAVDPHFDDNRYVYLYYASESGSRVSRFSLMNNTLSEETILIENIPFSKWHNGGRIKFGPDGLLYITTGDASNPQLAQDVNSLAGKILRINKDGSIPSDNPFGNAVYSYGHRNSQGIAWVDGQLYASEHGQESNDEINRIEKGANYGWPSECTDNEPEYVQPIRCYTEFTLAPSGIAYYNGSLYVAGLRGEQVRRLTLGENGTIVSEEVIVDALGRVREVVERDGWLYISTSNQPDKTPLGDRDNKIVRIKLP